MQKKVQARQMCETHRALLMKGVGYGPSDPWKNLEAMATMTICQAAMADPKVLAELGGDVERMPEIGCLGCRKPDAFGTVVETARVQGLDALLELGRRFLRREA